MTLAAAARDPTLSICLTCRDGREALCGEARGGERLARAALARLATAPGWTNVMDDADMSWGRVGWEAVGERDPEFIIVLDYGEDGGAGLIAWLEALPVMSQTSAVRNDRYLALKYAEITPGPANIGAVEKIARALRPGVN